MSFCFIAYLRARARPAKNFNHPFPLFSERRYIASAPSLSNAAELSKSAALLGSWMTGSGAARRSQVRAGQEIAPVGRTQSERCRRFALASGCRLSDYLEEIDRARRGLGR